MVYFTLVVLNQIEPPISSTNSIQDQSSRFALRTPFVSLDLVVVDVCSIELAGGSWAHLISSHSWSSFVVVLTHLILFVVVFCGTHKALERLIKRSGERLIV
ncbi:hypothetical protein PGT21_012213 [Puccinia graminis f. sp. tritici]|uniref:Uncharacterized protein n=1 Tax=Puccinia graminis f. sp. tritici TaxID=56615 RepID=A0A5B0NDR9_PUCGR|nr:hypothetical protein PGT21_012213 [Puccinia graminis f. sp. tritici]